MMVRLPYSDSPDVTGVMYQLPEELHHMNTQILSYASAAVNPFYSFSEALLDQFELDPKLRQLAMLRVAQCTKSHAAWLQHVALAQVVGVSDEQISSLQEGGVASEHFATKEQVALAFVDEVLQTPRVSDALFEQMWRLFTSREMVELLLVVGLSWMAGRVMTTFDLEPDSALRTRPLEMSHQQESAICNVRRTDTGHVNTIVLSSGFRA
jgi:alkylhydroperoxidase family enzyme